MISWTAGEHGTITSAKVGETDATSGAEFAEGTVITFVVAPDAGYVAKYAIGSTAVEVKDNTFTVTADAAKTITISFEEIPAGPVVVASLTFPDADSANNKIGGYSLTWTAKNANNVAWTITNFNNNGWKNNWTYIKCGHKNNAYVASIATSDAMSAAITKVVVTIDSIKTPASVKSIKLIVASDAEFKNVVETIDGTVATGDMTFAISADKQAANLFYKVEFDCAAGDGKTNGFIQVSKVDYYA